MAAFPQGPHQEVLERRRGGSDASQDTIDFLQQEDQDASGTSTTDHYALQRGRLLRISMPLLLGCILVIIPIAVYHSLSSPSAHSNYPV